MEQYCKPVIQVFSACPRIAFKYLDRIFESTQGFRTNTVQRMQICQHTSDNYQEWIAFAILRNNVSDVMHTGMVYNIVLQKEYTKPAVTITVDSHGDKWVICFPKYWTIGKASSLCNALITLPWFVLLN